MVWFSDTDGLEEYLTELGEVINLTDPDFRKAISRLPLKRIKQLIEAIDTAIFEVRTGAGTLRKP